MNEREALVLGNKLFRENGLYDWSIRINTRAKSRLGVCKFTDRKGRKVNSIEISSWIFVKCPGRVENTVRHEVAHAIAGSSAGHGPQWKKVARRLGAKPVACHADGINMDEIDFQWETVCNKCEITFRKTFRRRPAKTLANRMCSKCYGSLEQRKI